MTRIRLTLQQPRRTSSGYSMPGYTTLDANTTYRYRIRARGAGTTEDDWSDWSDWIFSGGKAL